MSEHKPLRGQCVHVGAGSEAASTVALRMLPIRAAMPTVVATPYEVIELCGPCTLRAFDSLYWLDYTVKAMAGTHG